MRNLHEYALACVAELESIGIHPNTVDAYTVNTRAKHRWGQCARVWGDHYKIDINYVLLDEANPEEGLKNTLIHELLHTIAMGHTGEWARLAAIVHEKLGYDIKRCDSAEDKGIVEAHDMESHKYCVRCTKCGHEWYYDRLSSAVKHPERCWHKTDGGKLERVW